MTDNKFFETKKETNGKQTDDNKNIQQEIGQDMEHNASNNDNDGENTQQTQSFVRRNIAKAISEYNDAQYDVNNGYKESLLYKTFQGKNIVSEKDSFFVKFLKIILVFFLVLMISCVFIGLSSISEVDIEKDKITTQVNNVEKRYYKLHKKYYYFSKASYDSVVGLNMDKYKYFVYYEVINNDKTNKYEIKLYGATNVFTITYYTVKSFICDKQL